MLNATILGGGLGLQIQRLQGPLAQIITQQPAPARSFASRNVASCDVDSVDKICFFPFEFAVCTELVKPATS